MRGGWASRFEYFVISGTCILSLEIPSQKKKTHREQNCLSVRPSSCTKLFIVTIEGSVTFFISAIHILLWCGQGSKWPWMEHGFHFSGKSSEFFHGERLIQDYFGALFFHRLDGGFPEAAEVRTPSGFHSSQKLWLGFHSRFSVAFEKNRLSIQGLSLFRFFDCAML